MIYLMSLLRIRLILRYQIIYLNLIKKIHFLILLIQGLSKDNSLITWKKNYNRHILIKSNAKNITFYHKNMKKKLNN